MGRKPGKAPGMEACALAFRGQPEWEMPVTPQDVTVWLIQAAVYPEESCVLFLSSLVDLSKAEGSSKFSDPLGAISFLWLFLLQGPELGPPLFQSSFLDCRTVQRTAPCRATSVSHKPCSSNAAEADCQGRARGFPSGK